MKIKVGGIIFQCDNNVTRERAETLLTKEPGTIEWLRQVRPGDVLWDIGANVGCYTLIAAKKGATVLAFEPHLDTAVVLAQNLRLNGLQDRVAIITAPLDETAGLNVFGRTSQKAGTSGHAVGGSDLPICEAVFGVSIASMIRSNAPAPNLMKIDVDGNELRILYGAAGYMSEPTLRSVQIEMAVGEGRIGIHTLMTDYGFIHTRDHFTMSGQRAIDGGEDPSTIVHNAVFERSAS